VKDGAAQTDGARVFGRLEQAAGCFVVEQDLTGGPAYEHGFGQLAQQRGQQVAFAVKGGGSRGCGLEAVATGQFDHRFLQFPEFGGAGLREGRRRVAVQYLMDRVGELVDRAHVRLVHMQPERVDAAQHQHDEHQKKRIACQQPGPLRGRSAQPPDQVGRGQQQQPQQRQHGVGFPEAGRQRHKAVGI